MVEGAVGLANLLVKGRFLLRGRYGQHETVQIVNWFEKYLIQGFVEGAVGLAHLLVARRFLLRGKYGQHETVETL